RRIFEEYKFLFKGKDRLHGHNGTFSYVVCAQCGLAYMNPQLSTKDLEAFYPKDYAPHRVKSPKPEQHKKSAKSKFRGNSPLAFICRRLNNQSRLLDVGCGNGKFLYEIQNLTGCQVYGVDISETAVAAAKNSYNLDIFRGTIIEAPFPNSYFDVITARSYLEHVNNPSEVLRKIYVLLKSDGNCVISCPNFDSLNAKLFKDKWYHLDCPRHLYLYTPKTIANLLDKTGFIITKIAYEKSSKGLLGSLQYYFYGNNFAPKHRNRIRRSSLVKAMVSPLTRITYLIKRADTMAVYTRKR
ncbi:MAG: class I SAM-dependent methyltransferase, partial [bacterium]